jgi:membrane protease YdiL (CAAX protease family)
MAENTLMRDSVRSADPPITRADGLILALAMVLPSVVTWIYFIGLADHASLWQQRAFTVGKSMQFALPVVWIAIRQPRRLAWPQFGRLFSRETAVGIAFGAAVVAGMVVLYFTVLQPYGWIAGAAPQVLGKVRGFGVASPLGYLGLAAFYALVHSGLEEYYWRWFVFGQLGRWLPALAAAVLSSIGFMAHHVIVLGYYFGTTPWAYLFSVAVGVGGFVWAWLYHRAGTIVPSWISHLLVDAGIFLVGYELVRTLWS